MPNKSELQQIVSNHSSDIGLKDIMKVYKDYTRKIIFVFNQRHKTKPNMI